MALVEVKVGSLVGGRYKIESVLDHGGMAVVYKARNTGTHKVCALKLIHPQLSTRPEIVRLFVEEAKVSAKIGDHPNIVDVRDAGIDDESGRPFIVMDLLQGETLEKRIERGPLPYDEVLGLFTQLGSALEQAHSAGIIHRDLKPSNIFIAEDREGKPQLKVMDFGIAKALETEIQRTATQVGTPAYAAPEQLGATARKLAAKQGVAIAKEITPATDVWALGLIAYESLTGLPSGHYWGVDTPAELPMRIALEDLEPASTRAGERSGLMPIGFDDWFDRCVQKDARLRWPSVVEAIDQLSALLALSAPRLWRARSHQRSASPPGVTPSWLRREPNGQLRRRRNPARRGAGSQCAARLRHGPPQHLPAYYGRGIACSRGSALRWALPSWLGGCGQVATTYPRRIPLRMSP